MENIRDFYRNLENFHRYTVENEKRVKELNELFNLVKDRVGNKTLDLACGGGILDFILESEGKQCTGIDVNPDMIEQALKHSKASRIKFYLGNLLDIKLDGVYDTVFFVGNSLAHFNSEELVKIVKGVNNVCRKGSTFIVDYRDVVDLFYKRKWKRKMMEDKSNVPMISVTVNFDPISGEVNKVAWKKGSPHNIIKFAHAVWSPFIIQAIMDSLGWDLEKRFPQETWQGWIDVYRFRGSTDS